MMTGEFPQDIFNPVACYLELDALVKFGTLSRYAHYIATNLADQFITSLYEGVHLEKHHTSSDLQSMPHWIRLLAALQPKILIKGYNKNWPDLTKPLSAVFESKGPFFLEYTIVASKAPNGTPTIGLVDADVSSNMMSAGEVQVDMSRWQDGTSPLHSGRCFAMSFSPGCAVVYATLVGFQELLGGQIITNSTDGHTQQNTYTANLNWPILGDETKAWNAPIQAGIFLEKGCLSLWRKADKHWHSSGIILRGLPSRVLPCIFQSSFVGYTNVRFSGIWNGPPLCCPHCDATGHGTTAGWKSWPLRS